MEEEHRVKEIIYPLCQDWLMKYGYLPPSDPSTGQLQAWTGVTSAVRAMQRFAGLKDSGVVGEEYRWCLKKMFMLLLKSSVLCVIGQSLFSGVQMRRQWR